MKLSNGHISLLDLLSPLQINQNFEVVCLFSCETNLGRPESNIDEILPLSFGFLYGGSKVVIGSLWKVDNMATSLLSWFFYCYFSQGYTSVKALQKAKVKLQKTTAKEFKKIYKRFHEYLEREAEKYYKESEYLRKMRKEKEKEKNILNSLESQTIQEKERKKAKIAEKLDKYPNKLDEFIKQKCQDDNDFPFEHPFYWAGFMVKGI